MKDNHKLTEIFLSSYQQNQSVSLWFCLIQVLHLHLRKLKQIAIFIFPLMAAELQLHINLRADIFIKTQNKYSTKFTFFQFFIYRIRTFLMQVLRVIYLPSARLSKITATVPPIRNSVDIIDQNNSSTHGIPINGVSDILLTNLGTTWKLRFEIKFD